MQVLAFMIADLRIGLAISDVVEAVRGVEISPLPGAPRVIEGLIDFRGSIAPVFDLRLRLVGTHADITPQHQLVIARSAGRLVALHVDEVIGLVELDSQAIESAESLALTSPGITGVATLPDGLLLIHDLATFLSSAEQATLDDALVRVAATQ